MKEVGIFIVDDLKGFTIKIRSWFDWLYHNSAIRQADIRKQIRAMERKSNCMALVLFTFMAHIYGVSVISGSKMRRVRGPFQKKSTNVLQKSTKGIIP